MLGLMNSTADHKLPPTSLKRAFPCNFQRPKGVAGRHPHRPLANLLLQRKQHSKKSLFRQQHPTKRKVDRAGNRYYIYSPSRVSVQVRTGIFSSAEPQSGVEVARLVHRVETNNQPTANEEPSSSRIPGIRSLNSPKL